jgi:hypothetical protein
MILGFKDWQDLLTDVMHGSSKIYYVGWASSRQPNLEGLIIRRLGEVYGTDQQCCP